MARLTLLLALAFVLAPLSVRPVEAATQSGGPVTGVVTLQGMRDRARPILIFAPTSDDPQLQIQLRTFAEHAPGLAERDITVIALPYRSPSPTPASMTDTEADAARRRFHVTPADFTMILIGKDGGEKLRSAKPISFEKLSATIDAMPMRRDEMRRQHPIQK